MSFALALRRLEVPYSSAGTLAEAQALLPTHTWSAFILDLELPDGSGLDLLDALRATPAYRHTPVAIITANILICEGALLRIEMAGASLHCGVFGSRETDAICRRLLNGANRR